MKKIVLYILVAAGAAACSSQETRETPPTVTDRSTGVPSTSASSGASTTQRQQPSQPLAGNPLADPNSPLAKRSVFFEYDSNSVKDEYRGMVTAHSRYMADKRDSRMRIEGNCDERGSREYNLALGQRRAESVKKIMTVLGVSDGRIETVSYGEEKPQSPGHDEQAWSQNRRADIKYSGE
ncbi:MAG: peptidoglycan-associated lipoprotein Pal [Burkholderiales bacterium]|nr:peptidoglycan-associated lipoprotein Pal [Burkholderiales bacterium]